MATNVGEVDLSIKVLKDQLIADVKSAVKDAASEANKQSKSASKSVTSAIGKETSALSTLGSVAKKAIGALGVAVSVCQVRDQVIWFVRDCRQGLHGNTRCHVESVWLFGEGST